MRTRPWIPAFLRFDAALNAAGVLVIVVAAAPLAGALGLSARRPLYAVAALLAVNGVELVLTARAPRPGMLTALALIDAAFVVLVLGYAATAQGAETWARWALVAVADATIVTAAAKLVGRRAPALA
ncbi:MAG TPA: hypothetical protein VNU01_11600 [Egibacteraceae bacterium]|nr:hypothetical protein [Egibacteraceae bacterium]